MSGSAFLDLSTEIALVLLGSALLLTVLRILRGPSLSDRVLALDTITVLGLGFIGVIALRTNMLVYLDIAIALSLVGFLATIALIAFIMRRIVPATPTRKKGRQ
jgi:multicomponent Na+:H+ antiporter subunit F